MRRLAWALGVSVLTLVFSRGLLADVAPGPRSPRLAPSARLEQRLERFQQRAAALASGLPSPSAGPAPSGSASPAPSASVALPSLAPLSPADLAQKWAARLATRHERREQHRAALVRQLGQHLSEPQVKAELALHSTRLAELARIEFLAQNARNGEARSKLLARVAKLSAREAERHRVRLAKLLAQDAAGAPSAGPSASAAAPAPSAKATP